MKKTNTVKTLVICVSSAAIASLIFAGSTLAKDSDFSDVIKYEADVASEKSEINLKEPAVLEDTSDYGNGMLLSGGAIAGPCFQRGLGSYGDC